MKTSKKDKGSTTDENVNPSEPNASHGFEYDLELAKATQGEFEGEIALVESSLGLGPFKVLFLVVVFCASPVLVGCLSPVLFAMCAAILFGASWCVGPSGLRMMPDPRVDVIDDMFDREGASGRQGLMLIGGLIAGLFAVICVAKGALPWLGDVSLEDAYDQVAFFGFGAVSMGLATSMFWKEYIRESRRLDDPQLLVSVEHFILESAAQQGSITAGTLAVNSRLSLHQASEVLRLLEVQGHLQSTVVGDGALHFRIAGHDKP
ncbi:hypothetical protein DL240_09090 [Lujinxingia litoralis]|uniref:Uncharacterized protein n=1 Tax=Lujinxingia litoralis TaxID=2211119 RepID=A0A328C607_9DELT|nr:hypothetical protein [Lujinxingia litoralis]RAL23031.1 hypothetical protein DL240_09090 [Lujinxingia litoralis]